jgi:hypothetical protein
MRKLRLIYLFSDRKERDGFDLGSLMSFSLSFYVAIVIKLPAATLSTDIFQFFSFSIITQISPIGIRAPSSED